MLETDNAGILQIGDIQLTVALKPLSFAIMDHAGVLVEYNTALKL